MNDFIRAKLGEIATHSKKSIEFITKAYEDTYNSVFIQTASLDSDEKRAIQSIRMVVNDWAMRPNLTPTPMIPIGYSGIWISKGSKTYEVYALILNSETPTKPTRINIASETGKLPKITLFSKYNDVEVGKYPKGGYHGDDRTVFEKPEMIAATPDQIIDKMGLPKFTLDKAQNYLSKTETYEGRSYVVKEDWRILDAMVNKSFIGKSKDGDRQYGVYTVTDETIPIGSGYEGFTIWAAPELTIYKKSDYCRFLGTVSLNEQGVPTMQCYCVLPLLVGAKS
jgi:hypothetical protein